MTMTGFVRKRKLNNRITNLGTETNCCFLYQVYSLPVYIFLFCICYNLYALLLSVRFTILLRFQATNGLYMEMWFPCR